MVNDGADPMRDALLFGRAVGGIALVMLAHYGMLWATFALIGIAFGASGSPV